MSKSGKSSAAVKNAAAGARNKQKTSQDKKLTKAAARRIKKQEEKLDRQHFEATISDRNRPDHLASKLTASALPKKYLHRCECGRMEVDAPLAMCVTCEVCGEWMHAEADTALHRHEELEPSLEVEDTVKEAPRRKERAPAPVVAAPVFAMNGAAPRWEFFFMCQRHPVLRSQLVTSLMAGSQVDAERVPVHLLLDAVLLATAAREFHEAEVVTDYQRLLERTEEEWRRPDWTCKVFDSIHGDRADAIINRGVRDFPTPESAYVPALAGWLLGHDVPEYFSEEITDDAPKAGKGRKR